MKKNHNRFKNGEQLKADDRLQLTALPDGTVKLLIQQTVPSDCGAYKLVATNPYGQTSALCAVAINRENLPKYFLFRYINKFMKFI